MATTTITAAPITPSTSAIEKLHINKAHVPKIIKDEAKRVRQPLLDTKLSELLASTVAQAVLLVPLQEALDNHEKEWRLFRDKLAPSSNAHTLAEVASAKPSLTLRDVYTALEAVRPPKTDGIVKKDSVLYHAHKRLEAATAVLGAVQLNEITTAPETVHTKREPSETTFLKAQIKPPAVLPDARLSAPKAASPNQLVIEKLRSTFSDTSNDDPYVRVFFGDDQQFTTRAFHDRTDATWTFDDPPTFTFQPTLELDKILRFELWDNDFGPDDLLATAAVPMRDIIVAVSAQKPFSFPWRPKVARYSGTCTITGRGVHVANEWINWVGAPASRCHPKEILSPSSESDLLAIVQKAIDNNWKIRVVGGGYSMLPECSTDFILVKTDKLKQAFKREQQNGVELVEAWAGHTVEDLWKFAYDKELAFPTDTLIETIHLGGAVANGVHGTGWFCKTVSDNLHSMTVVRARGKRAEVATIVMGADDDQDWKAHLVSLGALGIIWKLKFKTEPLYKLRAIDEKRDMKEVIKNLERMVVFPPNAPELAPKHHCSWKEPNPYVELFWFPFCSDIWVKRWWRTNDPRTHKYGESELSHRHQQRFCEKLKILGGDKFVMAFIEFWPALTPYLMRLLFTFISTSDVVASAPLVHHYQQIWPKIHLMSYAIPIVKGDLTNVKKAWNDVVEATKQYADEGKYPFNLTMHARFISSSPGYLAPSSNNEHTCMIEILSHSQTPGWADFFQHVQEKWVAIPGARPHWGKDFWRTPTELKDAYGAADWESFKEACLNLDPSGIFSNQEFIYKYLGPHNTTAGHS